MGNGFKKACKSIAGYVKSDKKTLRKLLLSVISLTLAIVVIVTMTFSWFTVKTSNLTAELFKLDCGKGLRVNDTGTTELSFSQVDKYLVPASSVDGRNLYFPTDGSDFSNITEYMTFRSANVGDKNQNYIQIDFTLTAQQNHTALYINEKKTSIKVAHSLGANETRNDDDWSVQQASALRSALWCSTAEDDVPNTPIVFNPTASTMYTAAVQDVDRSTGAFISKGPQVAHAFSEYSFGGEPVATLEKGVETKFSYIIWLEGTDPKCTDKIRNKDIQINLAFTTSWDKTESIRFEDQTAAYGDFGTKWVKYLIENDDYSLTLHYDEVENNQIKSSSDFNMYAVSENDANNNQWTCNIPGDMRNQISFILRPGAHSERDNKTYKFTMSSKVANQNTLDRGANRLYVAELTSATSGQYDKYRGYWMALGDSDGAGHDSGGSFDGDDF